MLRDASQRFKAVEAPAPASCCDAPQHEGEPRRGYFRETCRKRRCGTHMGTSNNRASVAALLVLFAGAGTAAAGEWPSRPLTLVVPFAAGGPSDVAGRILAQGLSENLGQQVVVENPS